MKKIKKISIFVVAVCCVASSASADISVGFQGAAPVSDDVGVITSGFVAKLIWSPYAPSILEVNTTGLAEGEIALVTYFGYTPGIFDATSLNNGFTYIFEDSDVGGMDVNAGYIFARLFHTSGEVISVGDDYLQMSLTSVDSGTLPTYTNPDGTKNTPFYTASITSAPILITADGLQVVPEPATLGLMGVAGLGMFLARRKVRR